MKNSGVCPKCGSHTVACVPDDAHRYLANSICMTKVVTVERIPVTRYVCGYVENWVESQAGRNKIKKYYSS